MLLLAIIIALAAPLAAFAQPEPEIEKAEPAGPIVSVQPRASEGSMETALIAAKALLGIDDDVYTEFNYSSGFSNYETREGLIWTFSWSDNKNGYIYAVVQDDGTVLQYFKYDYQGSVFGFAEISKDAAVKIADEFIRRAKPDTYSYFKTPDDVRVSIHDGEYRLNYYAEVNGYAFTAAYASVSINKFTGEVTGYSTSNVNPRAFNHESATNLISESAAVAAYAEKIGLRLEYGSYFNYEEGTIKVFPFYLLNSSRDRYISAKSGEVIEYVYDLGSDGSALLAEAEMMAASANDMAMGGSRANLTPAEIAAIDRVSNYLTSEQALEKLLEAMDMTDIDVNDFSQKYIGLSRDFYNRERYYYDIYLYKSYDWDPSVRDDEITGFFGRVDAESGRVTSFSIDFHGIPYSDSEYTEKQAEDAIEVF